MAKREKRQFLSFAVGLGLGDYCLLAFSDKIVMFELFGINLKNSYVARASNQSPTHLMKLGARDQR